MGIRVTGKSKTGLLSLALTFHASSPTAVAGELHWDGASTSANADGGDGVWSTAAIPANWNSSASGGTAVAWTDGSDPIFGGPGGIVTISGTVSPTSLSFLSEGYSVTGGLITFTGTPVIAVGENNVTIASAISGFPTFTGTPSISKTGSGTLALSGNNSFTGPFTIVEGVVKAGSTTPFGSAHKGTIVASGATLDLNGQSLGGEMVTFSGEGVNGQGAIVNTGVYQPQLLRYTALGGPATIGGPASSSISSGDLQMNGHTLTKIGPLDLHFANSNISSAGNIDVKEGTFWIRDSSRLNGSASNVITVRSGATLRHSEGTSPGPLWTASFENNSTYLASLKPVSWNGPMFLAGSAVFNVASYSLSNSGVISGPGSITKTGVGPWTLTSLSTYTGGTNLDAGSLILRAGSGGTGALRGAVTVGNGTTLTLAVPESLGTTTGERVSPLNIFGGVVDNTSAGPNNGDIVRFSNGSLRTNGGLNAPDALSRFTMAAGSQLSSLAAEAPSTISGRLDLGSNSSGIPTQFNVEAGSATEDLRIDAPITQSADGQSILKKGLGLLVLNGPCLYNGVTTVQEGSLMMANNGSLTKSPVHVMFGARFGTLAADKSLASLKLDSGSGVIVPVRTGSTTTVNSTLDLDMGSFKVSPVLGAATTAGTYDLVTAGSIIGTGIPTLDFSGAFGPTRATGSVAVNGNKLTLTLTGVGGNLIWNNASAAGAASGIWDGSTANFSNGGANDVFRSFDSVTFNDSVAPGQSKTLDLGSTLAPSLVTVENSNGDYTFTSSGGFAGAGSLVKLGSSSLVIGGSDGFAMAGSVIAGGGILDFSGKTLSLDALTITGGGEFNNATSTFNQINLESGSSTATLLSSADWTKTSAATVALYANNRLSGAGTIEEGNLIVGNAGTPNTIGSLGSGPVSIADGAAITFSRSNSLVITNSFTGTGALNLKGSNNATNQASAYSLTADNSSFSGPISIAAAIFTMRTGKEVGNGPITLADRAQLYAENLTVSNALNISAAGGWGILEMRNVTLTGPINLTGNSNLVILAYNPFGAISNMNFSSNTISGAIEETGGSASLAFRPDPPGSLLIISGSSSYTGTTQITGRGRVNLTGSLGPTAVTVAGFSTLGGSGSIGSGGSLNLQSFSNLWTDLSGNAITVNGNLTLGSSIKVAASIAQNAFTSGPVPILKYTGSISGSASQLAMDWPSNYRKAEFAIGSGQITVDIGSKALIWKGTSGSTWGIGGTKLWNTSGVGETESFYKGDSVRFDDTGSGSVSGYETLTPSAVMVQNTTKSYTISATMMGTMALTKNSSGTLGLSGWNEYTGGSFINSGRVNLQRQGLGLGPVMVASSATLAGNGTIPGTVNVAGTIDPNNDSFPGVISAGPTTITGSYLCALTATGSDVIDVSGDLTLTGAMLILNKTYNNWQKPAFFTIATYTGSLIGNFATVSGLPVGYLLRHDIAAKALLVAPMTFEEWINTQSGLNNVTPDGDPDHDGISNLLEHALGSNPSLGDQSTLQRFEMVEGFL